MMIKFVIVLLELTLLGNVMASDHEIRIYRTIYMTPTSWMMLALFGSSCDPPEYQNLSDPRCSGGVPALGSWSHYWRQNKSISGSVTIGGVDQYSTFVQLHPKRQAIAADIWKLLQCDFAVLRGSGIEKQKLQSNLTDTAAQYGIPLINSGIRIEAPELFYLYNRVMRSYHKEMSDGTRIGYIAVMGDWYFIRQIDYSVVLPRLVSILRELDCVFVVLLCTTEILYFSPNISKVFSTLDVDVIFRPKQENSEVVAFKSDDGKFYVDWFGWHNYIYSFDIVASRNSSHHLYISSVDVQTVAVADGDLPLNYDEQHYDELRNWLSIQRNIASQQNPYITTSSEVMPTEKIQEESMSKETAAGNLVAECLLDATNSDASLFNGGAIGYGWEAGKVFATDIFTLFKYTDHIVSYNVTGRSLWTTLELGVSQINISGLRDPEATNRGAFPQVAGVRFSFNPALSPHNRITSLFIAARKSNHTIYTPVKRGKIYTLTTVSFIALGSGAGYHEKYRSPIKDTIVNKKDVLVTTAIMGYLKFQNPYNSVVDGRSRIDDRTAINLDFLSKDNCTATQYFVEEELDCYECPEGYIGNLNSCILIQSSNSDTTRNVALISVGSVILALGLPVSAIFIRNKIKMRRLYNKNKLAEECANAVAAMRFEEVNYLYDLPKPTRLQRAFLDIIHNLKLYRPFLPSSLFPLEAGVSAGERIATEAPQGTISVVFTDIQGSTDTWERIPDSMRHALTIHNKVLRQLISDYKGYEVKTIGDAFMIVFANLENAVCFAGKAQKELMNPSLGWPPSLANLIQCEHVPNLWYGLRIRIGVHVGDAVGEVSTVTGRTDYFGPTINKAARVERQCSGGAIALSEEVTSQLMRQRSELLSDFLTISKVDVSLSGIDEKCAVTVVVPRELSDRQQYFNRQIGNPLAGRRNSSITTTSCGASFSSEAPSSDRGRVTRQHAILSNDFVSIEHCSIATILCDYNTGYGELTCNVQQYLSFICTCSDRTDGNITSICDTTVIAGWNTYRPSSEYIMCSIRFVGLLYVVSERHSLRLNAGLCLGDVHKGNVGTADQRFITVVGAAVEASRQLAHYARDMPTFATMSVLSNQLNPFEDLFMKQLARMVAHLKLTTVSDRVMDASDDESDLIPIYELRSSSIDSKLRYYDSQVTEFDNNPWEVAETDPTIVYNGHPEVVAFHK